MFQQLREVQKCLESFYVHFPYYDDIEEEHSEERDFIREGHPSVRMMYYELLGKHESVCRMIELASDENRIDFVRENYADMFCENPPAVQIECNHALETFLLDVLFGITEDNSTEGEAITVQSLLDYDIEDMQLFYDQIWDDESIAIPANSQIQPSKYGQWGTEETKELIWESLSHCMPLKCLRTLIEICVPAKLAEEVDLAKENIARRLENYHELLVQNRNKQIKGGLPLLQVPDYFDSQTWDRPFVCEYLWRCHDPHELLIEYSQH